MDVPILVPTRGIARHMTRLIVLAIVSLMPFHDDWQYEISPTCTQETAKMCQNVFLRCQSYQNMSINPVTGVSKPFAGVTFVTTKCFEDEYEPKCNQLCGYPADTGSWWQRCQRLGPWYLKFIPGASSYWDKLFSYESVEVKRF